MGGSVGNTIKRAGLAGVTGGLSEFARQDPFGAQVGNINPVANVAKGFLPEWASGYSTPNIGGSGSFQLDPEQLARDQQSIMNLAKTQGQEQTDLGRNQYVQTNQFISEDQASRDAARQRLAEALTAQNEAIFKQGMAGTLEDLNARHLANGSGVGQEFARQQGNIATNIANEIGSAGARDYTTASNQRAAALQNLLGSQGTALATTQGGGTNALSRGLSLEDFINSANVAKTIGAQAAPQVGNGKGQTGTLLSGIGATAPLIGAVRGAGKAGPAGAVVGGAAPLITSTIGSNLG